MLSGLRLCICVFICDRLMCFDTAPLWEGAYRRCQYFLPGEGGIKHNQNPTTPPPPASLQIVTLQYALLFRVKLWNVQAGSLHLERMFPVQPMHFLQPVFCCLFLLLFSKERECEYSLSFLAASGLGSSGISARLLRCQLEALQFAGVRHPEPGDWHEDQEN